jgi:hypothetical protein
MWHGARRHPVTKSPILCIIPSSSGFWQCTVKGVGDGMKDDCASPDGFELLDDKGMGQKPFGMGSNGDLDR